LVRQCEGLRWVSSGDQATFLTGDQVNLYDLVYNMVAPVTAPLGYELHLEAGSSIRTGVVLTCNNGLAVATQHDGRYFVRFLRGAAKGINDVPEGTQGQFAAEELRKTRSLAELWDSSAQPPTWFISHYWAESILAFTMCVEEHAKVRRLRKNCRYWVCAYTNDQHQLGLELGKDPLQTPFYNALRLCKGALLVLAEGGEAADRIWCGFEASIAFRMRTRYDQACIADGQPHVLTFEPAETDSTVNGIHLPLLGIETLTAWTGRQETFPARGLWKLLATDLERGDCSNEQDRSVICSAVEKDLGGMRRATRHLRSVAAQSLALLGFHSDDLCDALKADTELELLQTSLAALAKFQSAGCLESPNLDRLRIVKGNESCPPEVGRLISTVAAIEGLRELLLDLRGIEISEEHFNDFCTLLQQRQYLAMLDLYLSGSGIDNAKVERVVAAVCRPGKLIHLVLAAPGTEVTGDLAAIGEGIGRCPQLGTLELGFYSTGVTKAAIRTAWQRVIPRNTEVDFGVSDGDVDLHDIRQL